MKTFIDPKFECHRSVGEFTGRLLLQFADSMVIPFDPRDLTPALELGATNLKAVLPSNVNVTTGKSKIHSCQLSSRGAYGREVGHIP